MKVTIDGITYEGTPAEIRDIVENPPRANGQHIDCPDNDRWNYPRREPYCPNPMPTWWEVAPGIQRNWDGSPRVTCNTLGGLFGSL